MGRGEGLVGGNYTGEWGGERGWLGATIRVSRGRGWLGETTRVSGEVRGAGWGQLYR